MPDEEVGVNSAELAAEAVRDSLGGLELTETEPETEQLELAVEEEPWQPAEQYREEGPAVEEPVAPVEPVAPLEPDETFVQLHEMGIDFGVQKGDLPPELHEAYDRLASQTITAVNAYQVKMNQMQVTQAEMKQFAERLQNDPQKVLMTLAVTKPEAFQEAITSYQEMQEDERYKSMVIRELQAEAKLSAAERQQHVFQQREVQERVKIVTEVTNRVADKLGVDRGLAEKMVAMQITANGGDIDPGHIEGIISSLRPRVPTVAAPPTKAARVAKAPGQAITGQGTPPGPGVADDEASPGLVQASRNPFMSLVKQASRRIGNDQ